MALTNPRILYTTPTKSPYTTSSHFPHRRPITTISPPPPRGPRSSPRSSSRRLVVSLAKKLSSSSSRPTGKFDGKNRRGGSTSTKDDNDNNDDGKWTAEIESPNANGETFEGYVLPDLPGLEKDFFEGPEWDGFGFFVQYLWAFGIVFALISSGIAVATYNEGATDFKETPAYKESIQSQELLEEPEASNSDVFESNPTEEAPSLE